MVLLSLLVFLFSKALGVGCVIFTWDNRYSVLRSKDLFFVADCILANSILPLSVPIKSIYGNGLLEVKSKIYLVMQK